jgi:RNA polymerase sigma-70 factor (ECF subfamily)
MTAPSPLVAPEKTPPRRGRSNTGRAVDSWELVAAAQAGDREAFGQLYLRYQPMVEGFVSWRISDWATAQDLTSETFTRAWRRIDSVSDLGQGRDVGAWLITIARNLVCDQVRKSVRQRREQLAAVLPEPRPGGEREVVTPEEEVLAGLDRVEAGRAVARGLAVLSPDQRRCVELRDLRGCSIAETAAVMGRAPGAVKALHHRARLRLIQELRDTEQASTWHGRAAVGWASAAMRRMRVGHDVSGERADLRVARWHADRSAVREANADVDVAGSGVCAVGVA